MYEIDRVVAVGQGRARQGWAVGTGQSSGRQSTARPARATCKSISVVSPSHSTAPTRRDGQRPSGSEADYAESRIILYSTPVSSSLLCGL